MNAEADVFMVVGQELLAEEWVALGLSEECPDQLGAEQSSAVGPAIQLLLLSTANFSWTQTTSLRVILKLHF